MTDAADKTRIRFYQTGSSAVGKEIGKLKVTKVDAKFSICDVTDGEKNPPVGTRVTAGQ